jgi:sigma-B regulation protein RsbU (phosphoserine phosphatase)
MKKTLLLLAMLATVTCGRARGQSFEIKDDNLRATTLDGLWRFHTGDDPAWADPNFDDTKWSLLRSDRDWSTQGYLGYSGMAWYRFEVKVPAGMDRVSLLLPPIMGCFQVYADGTQIGAFGKMPPSTIPCPGSLIYRLYLVPSGNRSARKIVIALRLWHSPRFADMGGGPQIARGLVGESGLIARQYAYSQAVIGVNLANTHILALLQALAGFGTLALFALRRKEKDYLWFSLAMLLSAADNWLTISFYAHNWNFYLQMFVSGVIEPGASVALVAFLFSLLQPKRTLLLKVVLASLAAVPVLRLLWVLQIAPSLTFTNLAEGLLQFPLFAWVVLVVVSRARQRSFYARLLAVPVILSGSVNLLGYAASVTSILGWQNKLVFPIYIIWAPYPIQLDQITDALFLLAVFAILILRFSRTRSEEERYAGEIQAARNVQQYLIPEHLPMTPGLVIESVYRPAHEVGGDFFQVLPNASDGSVLIIVGDVAGHGMEAGMLATLIVGALRTANEFTSEPERILSLLNKRMQGRGLATCLALRIEPDGSAALVNAGHLPPYLNGAELPMEGALPLGAIPGIEFPVLHFYLAEGDSLMLMSDGIAEAQDAQGQLFGFERIGTLLRERATAAALATAAQNFGQEDDITVLTVARMTPPASSLAPEITPG